LVSITINIIFIILDEKSLQNPDQTKKYIPLLKRKSNIDLKNFRLSPSYWKNLPSDPFIDIAAGKKTLSKTIIDLTKPVKNLILIIYFNFRSINQIFRLIYLFF
jgi:hypothetical protein